MNSLTITIPLPPRAVSPNARIHWSKKASATKSYRREAWASAVAAINGSPPRWLKAKMQVFAYFPNRRFPDPGNLMASLKAAEDGICDAGIVANDRGLWPERPVFNVSAGAPRIEIIITEEL